MLKTGLPLLVLVTSGCLATDPPPFVEQHPVVGALRYVPSGTFTMGCLRERDGLGYPCPTEQVPAHEVVLDQAIYVMETELVQASWRSLHAQNPSGFVGDDLPVEQVNWWEAAETANALSRREGLPSCYDLIGCTGTVGDDRRCEGVEVLTASGAPQQCDGWRLPTEAEWEFAARGWQAEPYAGSAESSQVAWTADDSAETTHVPCVKARNGFGLCDLSGNVSEWTGDWWAAYPEASQQNPAGASSGTARVVRGGDWASPNEDSRVAYRDASEEDTRSN